GSETRRSGDVEMQLPVRSQYSTATRRLQIDSSLTGGKSAHFTSTSKYDDFVCMVGDPCGSSCAGASYSFCISWYAGVAWVSTVKPGPNCQCRTNSRRNKSRYSRCQSSQLTQFSARSGFCCL